MLCDSSEPCPEFFRLFECAEVFPASQKCFLSQVIDCVSVSNSRMADCHHATAPAAHEVLIGSSPAIQCCQDEFRVCLHVVLIVGGDTISISTPVVIRP